MSIKSLSVVLVFAMLLCMINVQAATIYVPDDYKSIQQAIDNTNDGDTIIVRDGIYKENVKIDKSVTLKSENGSANCIVQAAEITADNVTVSGFTIRGFTIRGAGIYIKANNSVITNNNVETKNHGIYLDHSNNNIITNNNIENSDHGIYVCKNAGICLRYDYGIYLLHSSNNLITNNNIENNNYGIYLYGSNNNTITNNKFTNDGLYLDYSYNNKVTNNTVNGKPLIYLENVKDYVVSNAGQVIAVKCNNITVKNLNLSNTTVGVEFWCTSNSRIENVVVENNRYGIYLSWNSNNNSITKNNIENNNDYGIYLYYYSSNNTITNNNIENNRCGIYLDDSNNNLITKNNIVNNNYGIYLRYSNNNSIYLNNFNNNIYSRKSTNHFNSPKPITYQYNGKTFTNYLGNYYNNYKGKDNNGDGIGETPYQIDSYKDNYPLIAPVEQFKIISTR